MVRIGANPGSGLRRDLVRLWDCEVTWAHLQPAPCEWSLGALDRLVEEAPGDVLLVLGHPPAWAARGGGDSREAPWLPPGSNRPPVTLRAWSEYVRTVAERYRGRIGWYQVWNEPADPAFYTGSWSRLARITARAHALIRRADPAARIVSAPLQPRPASGWPRAGAALMAAYGSVGYPVDVWSCHVYPETGRGPDRWEQMVRDVIRVLGEHGQGDRPLWVTETNFNVPDGPPLPAATARSFRAETERAARELGVDAVMWYAAEGMFGIAPSDL